jgi:hypothetical protein
MEGNMSDLLSAFATEPIASGVKRDAPKAETHWDMATELVAIEDGQRSTQVPVEQNLGPHGEPIEPLETVRNSGEFPTLTDQGGQGYPSRQLPKQSKS